jgi:glycosyltransferase involved in cell wall biosynthesis
MAKDRPSVLFETEGTYPFSEGGVSSWCQILIHQLSEYDFHLISVVGNQNVELMYDLLPNIKKLYMVPLWGIEEPFGYSSAATYKEAQDKKRRTTSLVIQKTFIPLFIEFLEGIENENVNIYDYAILFEKMNQFFDSYDYSVTMFSKDVWETFKDIIYQKYIRYNLIFVNDELPTILDLITCMRWLFHLLMTLNLPIPKTDLVHSSVAAFSSLPGIISKLRYGTPILLTEHGVYYRERYFAVSSSDIPYFSKKFLLNLNSLISRLSYEMADQISPVCKYNAIWEERLGAERSKIQVIYNGIDPDIFSPSEKGQSTKKRPTVVIVGKVLPIKDVLSAIKTAGRVRDSIPSVQFFMYGSTNADPPYYAKCKELVKQLKLEECFIFKGLKMTNPYEIYNEADLSFLSSVSEGHPYVVIESMSCQRPVVATEVGGVPEVIEGCGMIVQPGDIEAMANAIVSLLRDDELRLELGIRSRQRVIRDFNINKSMVEYRQSYERLLSYGKVAGTSINDAFSAIRKKMESSGIR